MEYRITKYNPKLRDNQGKYAQEEWTSYYDIGDIFGCKIFTKEQYYRIEDAYINCIDEITNILQLQEFIIHNYENYLNNKLLWKNNQIIKKEKLRQLIQDCLREKCWCKITANHFFLHFGYDYYIYVGCIIDSLKISEICNKYGLYGEIINSPYIKT